MNINNITNLSFNARINNKITRFEPVAREFRKMSRGIPGKLDIYTSKGNIIIDNGKDRVCADAKKLSKLFVVANPDNNLLEEFAQYTLNTLTLFNAKAEHEKILAKLLAQNNIKNELLAETSRKSYKKLLKSLGNKTLAPDEFKNRYKAI